MSDRKGIESEEEALNDSADVNLIKDSKESFRNFFDNYFAAKNSDTKLGLLKEYLPSTEDSELIRLINEYEDLENLNKFVVKTVTVAVLTPALIGAGRFLYETVRLWNYPEQMAQIAVANEVISFGVAAFFSTFGVAWVSSMLSGKEEEINQNLMSQPGALDLYYVREGKDSKESEQ